jgi:class 3 adenylate cyclase
LRPDTRIRRFLGMLGWHDRIVRDTAEEHRGFVVKSQGDGFMLAFPSASFAFRESLVMRDRIAEGFAGLPVRIRAGLHSGEAIKQDDDFYGRTVVIAARISALALGGEVLASDLVYALARGLGTFSSALRAPRRSRASTAVSTCTPSSGEPNFSGKWKGDSALVPSCRPARRPKLYIS